MDSSLKYSSKVGVIVIPDYVDWILGTWSKEILRRFSDKYDILVYPYSEIEENTNEFIHIAKKFDVIHCLSPWNFSKVRALISELGVIKPLMISSIHHILNLPSISDCLNADRIMTVCSLYTNELKKFGISDSKIKLIYNGVDSEYFRPLDKRSCREKLRISRTKFVIGFCGKASSNTDDRKGIDVFISSVNGLSDELKKNVEVVISGPGWNDIIKTNRFRNINVKYFPFLESDQMPIFYNALDVYLITSKIEGGPVPLLEAMSCGIIPVSTSVGMVPEVMENGINGVLIPFDDISVIIRELEKLIVSENITLESMGSNARETILRDFTWSKTLSGIHDLYHVDKDESAMIQNRVDSLNLSHQLIEKDELRWRKRLLKENNKGSKTNNLKKKLVGVLKRIAVKFIGR